MTEGRHHRVALILLVGALVAGGVGACSQPSEVERITIGVGPTTEQRVLAAMTQEVLTRFDIAVEPREIPGQTTALRRRARAGAIDLYWDYTGAAWTLGLGERVPPATDPVESYEQIRNADERMGLYWLAPTRANATLALFVRREALPGEDADRSLTWLAGQLSAGDARLCADPDFLRAPGGLAALAVEYAINLDQVEQRPATEDQAIAATAEGTCFAGLATATSGAAELSGLVPVADVQAVFPAFVVAPVMHVDDPVLRQRVEQGLAPVVAALDTTTLARLNAEVLSGADPAAVAADFVDSVAGTPSEGAG